MPVFKKALGKIMALIFLNGEVNYWRKSIGFYGHF